MHIQVRKVYPLYGHFTDMFFNDESETGSFWKTIVYIGVLNYIGPLKIRLFKRTEKQPRSIKNLLVLEKAMISL